MTINTSELIQQDLNHIWHPCSQMKDYENFKPLVVTKARGSYIELEDGRKIIDAISSWWCKTLGHNHPRLKQALLAQVEKFEHVILANTTHEVIVKLSEQLAQLSPHLSKVFYAGDGSCAIEIAMKMSLHTRLLRGESKKTRFIALENGYHGETAGALSVSDIGIYRKPYAAMLFDTEYLSPIPYVNSTDDPLWSDCSSHWEILEKKLSRLADTTTAIILEPILQAAAGMKIYSQDFLKRLRVWSEQNNVHLIADEIMTGLGRTGKWLACEHAGIHADFVCLAKALTAGWMPFTAVLTSDEIYQYFYDDYSKGKSFLHSHTHSGNALGASIALESLRILREENLVEHANDLGNVMREAMCDIAETTGKLTNIRQIGAVVAADLICDDPKRRLGFEVYQRAVALGALLRPLANTIYWVLPLNTEMDIVSKLQNITQQAISGI